MPRSGHERARSGPWTNSPTATAVLLAHESLLWLAPHLDSRPRCRIGCCFHGTPTHSLERLPAPARAQFARLSAELDVRVAVSPHLAGPVGSVNGACSHLPLPNKAPGAAAETGGTHPSEGLRSLVHVSTGRWSSAHATALRPRATWMVSSSRREISTQRGISSAHCWTARR